MMFFDRRRRRILPSFLLVIAPLALPACGGPDADGPSSGLTCVDDSTRLRRSPPEAPSAISSTTRIAPGSRRIRRPEAYASGVRLFALKNKKKDLTCDELARGRDEADRAPGVLRGPEGVNLTSAQKSRGIMLASEVSRELGAEIKRRCKKA